MAKVKESMELVPAAPGIGGPVILPTQGPVFSLSPYVAFTSGNAKYSEALPFCPGLSQGDPVLFQSNKNPVHLDPFRFFLVHSSVHYTETDDRGTILRSSFNADDAAEDSSLVENVEAVILCVVGDALIPARCSGRKAKAKAFWNAINAYKEASTNLDAWAARGPDYKATLAVQDARFRYSCTVKMKHGCKSRSKGFTYSLADGIIKPSTVADWALFSRFFKDEDFGKACARVYQQWQDRIEEVRSHCEG